MSGPVGQVPLANSLQLIGAVELKERSSQCVTKLFCLFLSVMPTKPELHSIVLVNKKIQDIILLSF